MLVTSFNVLKLVSALLEYIDLSVSEGGLSPLYNVRGGFSPLAPLSAAYELVISPRVSIL